MTKDLFKDLSQFNAVKAYIVPHMDYERKKCKSCKLFEICIKNNKNINPLSKACPEYTKK